MKNLMRSWLSAPAGRTIILTVASILFFAFLLGLLAQAQTDVPKAEIGGHVSVLRLTASSQRLEKTAVGGGLRGTFNLNSAVAFEGEVNFYPELNANPIIIDSKAVTGLFGVKAGWRSERMGIFGKVRPGLMHFEEKIDPRIVFIVVPPVPQNPHFVMDVGGVFEIYPSRRTVIRFDIGDTIIRFRYKSPLLGDSRFTNHNLQFNAGIGFRFF